MLRGFEKLTDELTDDELKKFHQLLKVLEKELEKRMQLLQKIICDKMNLIGVRLRKIIHFY